MLAHFIFLSLLHLISSYTVVPDDCHTNAKCHHYHNLHYYVQNSTKYFTHNTQLLFLPGVHCLHTDLVIENVHNISLIGRGNDYSNTSTVIQCNSSVGIIMKNITKLSMENIVIKNCLANSRSADVIIQECSGVQLHHVQIYHTHHWTKYRMCLNGLNVLGNSYFDHVSCDKQIYFHYTETIAPLHYNQVISLDHYNIVGNITDSYTSAIYIGLNQFSYSLTFQILNTNPKTIQERFLEVQAKFRSKCTIIITNCQFNDNHYKTDQYLFYLHYVNAYFSNCHFVNHDEREAIISIYESEFVIVSYCTFHHNKIHYGFIRVSRTSNITIEHCKFYENKASIFDYITVSEFPGLNCTQTFTVILKNTTFVANRLLRSSLIEVFCARLLLIGPVGFYYNTINPVEFSTWIFTLNEAYVPIKLIESTITIYGYIEFSQNTVGSLIKYTECDTQECFFMNIADNATLMIFSNTLITYFYAHSVWYSHYHVKEMKYPPCYFQYLNSSTTDSKVRSIDYSITFKRNIIGFFILRFIVSDKYYKYFGIRLPYSFQMELPITHCYWLPHSAFTVTIPIDINEKYVTFINNSERLPQSNVQKLLCYCVNDTQYDCYKDDLGYLYPGQTMVAPFCYPGNLTSTGNAEVVVDTSINGTHFTPCTVHKHKEFIQFTSKKCTELRYTIAFITESWCELFLKVPFKGRMEHNVFYVRQLPCPLGYIKKDDICQCHPSFKHFDITECNINNQTILRPTNSWISATNHDNYYISLYCPFYYCKQYSSYLNLITPELQCQFNRSGLLCGQCQQGLSTVFGSPNCQHCSSIYLLLIIPIAIVGIILVLLLFLLNLTVTDGTINAFILYANIISINSTTFFPDYNSSQNTFEIVFISLANLDLGIKTCFYNGMDDYAKMWLQLAFPFYLILIAALLILASRYSATVQKITAHRALPVLATLFLLSYAKVLRIVSIALFFYSSITHLPSEHSTLVWSVDANVPLFGVKFTLLFVVCLILFLAMIPFNGILLFTKTVSRFNIVTKFKPLLDAYQGPYKIKFYYWTGLQLMLRTVFFGLSSLDSNINLTIGMSVLIVVNIVHAYSKPFKNKIKNYQESLFILNLLGLYIFTASFAQNDISKNFVNVLIIMAMAQLALIVIYHIFEYACNSAIKERARSLLYTCHGLVRGWVTGCYKRPITTDGDQLFQLHDYNIPEVTYNYHEYQEPLIGQEYCM